MCHQNTLSKPPKTDTTKKATRVVTSKVVHTKTFMKYYLNIPRNYE